MFVCASGFAAEKAAQKATPATTASIAQREQPKAEVRTIFQYKKELGLTDKQENNLRTVLDGFQKYLGDKRKEIGALQIQLGDMIKKKEDLKTIRKQLEKIARVQVDASYVDIETSRKVENILTADQLAKWKAIQEEFQRKLQQMKEAQAQQQRPEEVKK